MTCGKTYRDDVGESVPGHPGDGVLPLDPDARGVRRGRAEIRHVVAAGARQDVGTPAIIHGGGSRLERAVALDVTTGARQQLGDCPAVRSASQA